MAPSAIYFIHQRYFIETKMMTGETKLKYRTLKTLATERRYTHRIDGSEDFDNIRSGNTKWTKRNQYGEMN